MKWTLVLSVFGLSVCAAMGASKQSAPPLPMIGPRPPSHWPPAATEPASTQPVNLPEMRMHTPSEELAMTRLQPGYHLELIASEPQIISPVCLAWDGDGRMYDAEMRSYMLDINGSHEKDKISRVSRFEDVNGDGSYARRTVFADHLLLPREILPLDDRILINETDSHDLYAYRDTKSTGIADEKVKVYDGGFQTGNLEHQSSGLYWNIDNWIYQTHYTKCLRFTHGKFETDNHGSNAGQWGIAFDDYGRLLYATAGNDQPAHDFQAMPQYGRLELPGEMAPGFGEVFPLLPMTDVQGGPKRVKSGGGLNHFTGGGGACIYRGDTLPPDLYGDYILPEPVGRLIRRAKVRDIDGKRVVSNAYEQQEFIVSTDANFRPIWSATGPDGCIYICDMYHGIIQESQWTQEGSYLRPQIKKYGLDRNINAGRIYRLVYDGMKRRPMPHMLEESPAELIKHLFDPNGWWRDTAQKLIILKGDKSIVPQLRSLAMDSQNALERFHAFWTLEGLDSADADLIIAKLKDSDWHIRCAAIRIAEPLIKAKDSVMMEALKPMAMDAEPAVAEQYFLSLIYCNPSGAEGLVKDALAAREQAKLKVEIPRQLVKADFDAIAKAKAEAEKQAALKKKNPALATRIAHGKELYSQTCIACHGENGQGQKAPDTEGTLAPPLDGSRRLTGKKDILCRIVLRGLVGPHDYGKTYPNEMAGFIWADDAWLSDVLTYARQSWSNRAGPITPADLTKSREDTANHDRPYTLKELEHKDDDD